ETLEPRVDRNEDSAGFKDAEHRDNPPPAVRRPDGDAVTGLDTGRDERGGELPRRRLQLGVGQRAVIGDDRVARAVALDRAIEQGGNAVHAHCATSSNAAVTASGSVIIRSWPVSMSHSRPSSRARPMRSRSRVASVDVHTMW